MYCVWFDAISLLGKWEGLIKSQPWGSSASLPHCQRPHCGPGASATTTGSWSRVISEYSSGWCMHADRYYLRAHCGSCQTPTKQPTCARHLSISAFRQVRTADYKLRWCTYYWNTLTTYQGFTSCLSTPDKLFNLYSKLQSLISLHTPKLKTLKS